MICRPLHRWILLVLVVALAPWRTAAAQEGHAWFVVESAAKDQSIRSNIVHLPPPDRMSPRGSVRNMVQGFRRAPERLAWSGNDLYILRPAERVAENENERRVYTISAVPGLISGWEYSPADRPESLPTIRGAWGSRDLEVVGFAAGHRAPAVLMQRAHGPYMLIVLSGTSWIRAPLPWERPDVAGIAPPGPGERCRFITTGASFGVLIERGRDRASTWYLASADDLTTFVQKGEGQLRWTTREVVADPPTPGAPDTVYSIENQLLRVTLSEGKATLSVMLASEEDVVATLADVGPEVRVAPSQGPNGFLAILSLRPPASEPPQPPADAAAAADAPFRLVEITPTGRILYEGAAKQGGPVSVRDVQLLSVLLVMVMAAVVVFVLRPERAGVAGPGGAVPLPAGIVPAEGGRRVLAQVMDLGIAWLVASLIMRIDITDVTMPEVLFGTLRGWVAIAIAAGTTLVLGVVMEWQFGLTIGKMLVGCRVVKVKRRAPGVEPQASNAPGPTTGPETGIAQRVTFGGAVIRNLAKWTPWNVVEFLATGRQRAWADRVAGTMVVVPVGNEPEGGRGGDE